MADTFKKTFVDWEDKIEIVEKYVGDRDKKDTITLEHFFDEKSVDYIKADIEGAEEKMLVGKKRTFRTKIEKALNMYISFAECRIDN